MRKVISLIIDYFLILLVGLFIGLFIFLQYFNGINLVAGISVPLAREVVIYGIFSTFPVLFLTTPFCLVLYKIRHRSNPKASLITFICLCLLNWCLFYPLILTFQNTALKTLPEESEIHDSFTLSKGYFRKANDKLYYFKKTAKENSADVILLNDKAEPSKFSEDYTLDLSDESEFHKSTSPYRDPLIKESLTDIPYYVIEVFKSIKIQAFNAWKNGFISWACFISIGFALASVYGLIRMSSWRMINALLTLTLSGLVIWFNHFYFSPFNENIRRFFQSLFYDGGHLGFFLERNIEFPLMLINIIFGLVFIIIGIFIAILRHQEEN